MCLHGVLVGTEIWHSVDKSFVSRRRPVKYSVGKGLPTQQEADPDSPPTPLNDYCPTWKTRSCCTNMKASNSQLALGKQHWWPQMNRTEENRWAVLPVIRKRLFRWLTEGYSYLAQFYHSRKRSSTVCCWKQCQRGHGEGTWGSKLGGVPSTLSFLTKAIMETTLTRCKTQKEHP